MPKPKHPYSQAFRDQMVELVRSGLTPSELPKEFGCHTTSILSCARKAGGSAATRLPVDVAALNAQERLELIELRRNPDGARHIGRGLRPQFADKSEKTFTPSMNS